MGQYHFAVPASDRFDQESMIAAQMIGLEGIPWPCKTNINGNTLSIYRNLETSGRLLVPFRTSRYGELALCTGTLPEIDLPYQLELELARGSLSRLRNQISIWREGGLEIAATFDERIDSVIEEFAQAVFLKTDEEQEQQRIALCEAVIDQSVILMFEITDEYSRQIAAIHNTQANNVPVIAGAVIEGQTISPDNQSFLEISIQRMIQPRLVESSPDSHDSKTSGATGQSGSYDFSMTSTIVNWLSDAAAQSVRILGPLMPFDSMNLPGWMPEDASFENRLDAAKRICRSLGAEYAKRIKILHVASGISGVGHQHFNYPQQLQMTLEMLEALDQVMPNTSMMVSFDQPWGERLSMATGGVQAMEIADALLRYGARVSAIGLEFNLDFWPQGSMMRDPLQWVDLIDRWSQFGLPLAIYLTAPTGMSDETGKNGEPAKTDGQNSASASRFMQTLRGSMNLPGYKDYLTTVFNLLIRRPAVNVVAWRRSTDADNRRFPLTGLFDENGQEKPVFQWFTELVASVNNRSPHSDDDTNPGF